MTNTSSQATRTIEQRFQSFVGWQLRVGALLAIAIAVVGIAMLLLRGDGIVPAVGTFSDAVITYRSFDLLWTGLCAGEATAVMQLAVCVLIATPLLRIACSLIGFIIEGDWLYTAITLVVAAIIGSTIFLGM